MTDLEKLYNMIQRCGSMGMSCTSDGHSTHAYNMYININKSNRRIIKKFYYQVVLERNGYGVYCVPVKITKMWYYGTKRRMMQDESTQKDIK